MSHPTAEGLRMRRLQLWNTVGSVSPGVRTCGAQTSPLPIDLSKKLQETAVSLVCSAIERHEEYGISGDDAEWHWQILCIRQADLIYSSPEERGREVSTVRVERLGRRTSCPFGPGDAEVVAHHER